MDEYNTAGEMHQFYNILNDFALEEPDQEINDSCLNDGLLEVDLMGFLQDSNITKDDALSCNMKFFPSADGHVYLSADTMCEDNLTCIRPQLLSVFDENSLDETMENLDKLRDPGKDKEKQPKDIFEVNTNLLKLKKYGNKDALKRTKTKKIKKKQKNNFVCNYLECGKICSSAYRLSVHTRSHTCSRSLACPIQGCTRDFATGYSLKTHVRTHTGEKPYNCDLCCKNFKTTVDLQKHLRTHTGEKPFQCTVKGCDKTFSTSNIRKVHVRSHTGERPYQCVINDCGKAFSSITNYNNHVRIHSGEKPYHCSIEGCEKRFTEYSSLYKHKLVHDPLKEIKCRFDDCSEVFKSLAPLKKHLKLVHDVIHISHKATDFVIKPDSVDTSLINTQ